MHKIQKNFNWEVIEHAVGFGLMGSVILIVSFTSTCLWLLFVSAGIAEASVMKATAGQRCDKQISQLSLAGTFELPGAGSAVAANKLRVRVGHKATGNRNVVTAVLSKSDGVGSGECLAECHMIRFERFQKDHAPALLEFECEGTPIRTMRMPLHIQWLPTGTRVRMGSSIFRTDEAKLKVEVDRYRLAAKIGS